MINDTLYILYDIITALRAVTMYLTTPPNSIPGGLSTFPLIHHV